ncbi:MAG TPA: hypothetical protein VN519_08060 [Bryobacteraceae bacterium]|nr:hypothetical protein [Bryobacteraceae bacterium]
MRIIANAGSPKTGYRLQDMITSVFARVDVKGREHTGSDPAAANLVARKDLSVDDGDIQT